jgi:hypothetical protein
MRAEMIHWCLQSIKHQFFEGANPQWMIVQTFNQLKVLATMLFKNLFVFTTNLNCGLQAIGCESRAKHQQALYTLFSQLLYNFIAEWLQPLLIQTRLKCHSIVFFGNI